LGSAGNQPKESNMAILSIGKLKGDPDDLVQRSSAVDDVVSPKARANGGIFHAAVRTDDGLMFVNVWENEEGRQATANDPDVQAAVQAAMGDTPPPEWTAYDVVRYEQA
jgi:quinol monooxygenase YgiN